MWLIWPFVSRAHHEDVKALLEHRIADLTRENEQLRADLHKSLDHYAVLSHGRAMFDPSMTPQPEPKPETPEEQAEQSQASADIAAAKRAGLRTRAQIAEYISRLNEQRHLEKLQNPDFAQAEAEGIEAARRSVQ
jgi:hypothetical protein